MVWNERAHRRNRVGEFAEKHGSAPETNLTDGAEQTRRAPLLYENTREPIGEATFDDIPFAAILSSSVAPEGQLWSRLAEQGGQSAQRGGATVATAAGGVIIAEQRHIDISAR